MDSDGKKLETKYPEQLTCWGHLTDTQNWQMEDKQKVLVEEYLVTWKAALNFAKWKKKNLKWSNNNICTYVFARGKYRHFNVNGELSQFSKMSTVNIYHIYEEWKMEKSNAYLKPGSP